MGASAGGLEAFTQLLQALPADTGMAFVLVQHLSPTHASALAEILSRATRMPVAEVTEECPLVPDHVHVIPPGRTITLADGKLHLLERDPEAHNHPIDLFFGTLAQDKGHHAIGVVLSGTATDGTLGLEEIKAAGGITFAQDDSAKYDGMPKSAAGAGCVDFVLSPAGIAAELTRIARHPGLGLPFREDADRAADSPGESKARLAPVLQLLSEATRVDFEQYKVTTLRRRITRRMVLLKLPGVEDYARYLAAHPDELQTLFGDILINVTGFFRDPLAFKTLGTRVIPKLLEGRSRHDPVRVWVAGCANGEEAYSLAMLLAEAMPSRGGPLPVHLFATDINPACIQKARAGVFSKEAVRGLSSDRLRRFFVPADGGFHVSRAIRDMCVFAVHNLLSDPPFSGLDLVSCRNLLIYLEPAAQKRVIALLHYALKPVGFLLLGGSESVGGPGEPFEALDAKHKVYRKRPGPLRALPHLPIGHRNLGGRATPVASKEPIREAAPAGGLLRAADRLLLQRFVPPGVLVDDDLEILQFSGDTGPFLAPQGKASLNLLKMAREGLTIPLRSALQRARKSRSAAREEGVRIKSGGKSLDVDLEVLPIPDEASPGAAGGFVILFEGRANAKRVRKTRRGQARKPGARAGSLQEEIDRLEHELATTREHLRSLVEHEQAAHEELQSANEEAQSANEELQSLNEELQTSKEEIQSSNEELTTVNEELHNRNLELEHLNNDLLNLIVSIDMAVVIVGRDLCIRRYSPAAGKLLNVIASDIGRPISDIRMKVDLPDLAQLLTASIDTVSALEREVQDEAGTWYSLRIRPYVTVDNKIDGAVVMLMDVDKLRRAREYAESLVATVRQPLLVLDGELCVQAANRSFYATFGVGPDETIGHLFHALGGGQWNFPALRRQLREVLPKDNAFEGFVVDHEFAHVGRRVMLLNARRFTWSGGREASILLAFEDITERSRLEQELRARIEQMSAQESMENEFLAVLAHELRTPLSVIITWAHVLQRPETTPEELKRGLEIIQLNTRQQHEIIGDLLDAHRISTGKVSLDLQRVDLLAAIDEAIASLQPMAADKGLHLERNQDATPALVSADPTRIRQVLANLVTNAIKFTPAGGRVQITLRTLRSRAEVSVTDTGEGIGPEHLPRLFERFRHSDPLTSRPQGGLGLGLAVTKQLVELHGGVLSASSPGRGKGATFVFSLPVFLSGEADVPAVLDDAGTSAGRPVSLAGIKILVVDEDPGARESLRRVLEGAGAEVLAVASAYEALRAVRSQAPDLLLSDIHLKGRSGYQLMNDIRALPAESGGRITAIALTAYPSANTQSRVIQAGFQMHLAKPIEAKKLVVAVAAMARLMPPSPA
ncbi:MAG TPA: chemotaxis protein CheB [Planctomycetota bacterium]